MATVSIRISVYDHKRLTEDFKKEYQDDHPELKDEHLSTRFLLSRALDFCLKQGEYIGRR